MGSVSHTNGITATNLAGFAPGSLALNSGNAAHHLGNATSPSSAQPSPPASQRGASSDNNGPPSTSNGVRQSEQPSSSASPPLVDTTNGSTSPHRNTTPTPATPSPSPGPTKGPGDAANVDTLPTGNQHPGTSSSDALHKSAATSPPVSQGADSSIVGQDDTRGRSTTPSNAPVSSTAPVSNGSRGSPLRTNMEDIHEAARKARMAGPINGLGDAPVSPHGGFGRGLGSAPSNRGGYTSPAEFGRGRGSTPSSRGGRGSDYNPWEDPNFYDARFPHYFQGGSNANPRGRGGRGANPNRGRQNGGRAELPAFLRAQYDENGVFKPESGPAS